MKNFKVLLFFIFVVASIAKGQKGIVIKITEDLFTKNEIKYPSKSDSMPSYLVYDSIKYAQEFPFGYYKRRRGFKNYEFTLIGWFLKSTEKNNLFPFENFVHGVILDNVEKTQANYPFVLQGNGMNGLNEVLYMAWPHMDLNPKGTHDFTHYTGYLNNGIPDFYGSFDHLSLNGRGGLLLEECKYKGNLIMGKRNGEGCYSNGRPEVERRSLEYERSVRSDGMNYPNVRYGIPITQICGSYNMDTLLFAKYSYEDGSSYMGTIDMPYIFPPVYNHYGRFFELKGNGTFTKSDGTTVTGQFLYPYIFVNNQPILVANPNNIQRDDYVATTHRLCEVCSGSGMVSKGVRTSGGSIVYEKTDLGNGYVKYNATRNAPTTFTSLKTCTSCKNGRVAIDGYERKVTIKN